MPKFEVVWSMPSAEEGMEIIEADSADEAESEVLDNIDSYNGTRVDYENTAEATEV